MRRLHSTRLTMFLCGVAAVAMLGACGGPEDGTWDQPDLASMAPAAASGRAGTCTVFGRVTGAVAKGVRITASRYCDVMGCGGKARPPKSTTTNAAGEFGMTLPSTGETYVLFASLRGYVFTGGARFGREPGELVGPVSFVASSVEAPASLGAAALAE